MLFVTIKRPNSSTPIIFWSPYLSLKMFLKSIFSFNLRRPYAVTGRNASCVATPRSWAGVEDGQVYLQVRRQVVRRRDRYRGWWFFSGGGLKRDITQRYQGVIGHYYDLLTISEPEIFPSISPTRSLQLWLTRWRSKKDFRHAGTLSWRVLKSRLSPGRMKSSGPQFWQMPEQSRNRTLGPRGLRRRWPRPDSSMWPSTITLLVPRRTWVLTPGTRWKPWTRATGTGGMLWQWAECRPTKRGISLPITWPLWRVSMLNREYSLFDLYHNIRTCFPAYL